MPQDTYCASTSTSPYSGTNNTKLLQAFGLRFLLCLHNTNDRFQLKSCLFPQWCVSADGEKCCFCIINGAEGLHFRLAPHQPLLKRERERAGGKYDCELEAFQSHLHSYHLSSLWAFSWASKVNKTRQTHRSASAEERRDANANTAG